MNRHLLLLTVPCTLAFGDGFAPIDYGPMEDYIENEEKIVSCADEVGETDLLADKEYFPEPKGGSVELGTSAIELEGTALPDQTQDRTIPQSAPDYFPTGEEQAIPQSAPDYFPSGEEQAFPGNPNQPVPYTKQKPPLSPQPPSPNTPRPQDSTTP